jgi:alkylated DNA repair dioxygenase AlkB
LLGKIQTLPFAPFRFGAYEGKRRVVSFGVHYDFSSRRLTPADPMPDWLRSMAGKVELWAGLPPEAIEHALVTEYAAGVSIGWHKDRREFDEVFGLSLNTPCRLRFRRSHGAGWRRFELTAQPRSLYRLAGEARLNWEHSIPAVESLRYSITFRTAAREAGHVVAEQSKDRRV